MKKKFFSRAVCCILTAMLCLLTLPVSYINAATVLTDSTTGTEDGYAYELWKDSGNTTMTLTGGGTFSCEWSNINNALFRTGKKYDCTQTYKELGDISVEYGVDYQPNGNSYMCVYGWTKDPLIEYYIVESWGSWRPPGADSSLGQITVDGGTYDIYKTVRENQPSIIGNTTFNQYWSVRTSKPTATNNKIEGTISVSEHFKAWEKLGLTMGKMYEVALTIEGYQSSGKATVYKNNLNVGSGSSEDPTEPDNTDYYFHDTFESNTGDWVSRGGTTVSRTSSQKATGSNSLSVTGRTSSWHGAAHSLNTATFKPSTAHSFSTYVMQNSVSSESFKLSLQYDVSGETKYATIAEANAASGEWVQLANKNYTIPAGASNLLLYVETADSTNSFYIDEAATAASGTDLSVQITPTVTTTTTKATTTTTTTTTKATTKATTTTTKATTKATTTTTAPIVVTPTLIGDANADGEIGVTDAIVLSKYLINSTLYPLKNEIAHANSDVNSDKNVNNTDVTLILEFIAGAIKSFV